MTTRSACSSRLLQVIVSVLLLAAFWGFAADKNPNSACLDCHSDKTLYKTNAAGQGSCLFVDET